jgi:lysophosphatidate acyltransferase
LNFKKGSFHVAIESQCGIQPVVVSRYSFLDSERKIFGRGKIMIKILPEISTKGMTKNDVDSLTNNVRKIMQEKYEEINDYVEAERQMKYF